MKYKILLFICICALILTGCEKNSQDFSDATKVTASAIYTQSKDNGMIDMMLLDNTYKYTEFKLSEDVMKNKEIENFEPNILCAVNFVIPKDEQIPIVTNIERIQKATITAIYSGLADENSAEFLIGENHVVFNLSDNVKSYFNDLKENIKVTLTLEDTQDAGDNMIVSDVHYDKQSN